MRITDGGAFSPADGVVVHRSCCAVPPENVLTSYGVELQLGVIQQEDICFTWSFAVIQTPSNCRVGRGCFPGCSNVVAHCGSSSSHDSVLHSLC